MIQINWDKIKKQINAKGEFKFVNSAETKTAELYFYGSIDSKDYGNWVSKDNMCPSKVADALKEAGGKDINIYINSPGGSVFAGIAIYNQLKRYKGYKKCYIDSVAASAASLFPQACDETIMSEHDFIMVHKPSTWGWGNTNDFAKVIEDLNRAEDSLINIYSDNLKDDADIDEIKQMVNDETWLNGEEADKYFKNIIIVEKEAVSACCYDEEIFNHFKNIPKQLNFRNDILNNLDNVLNIENQTEKESGKKVSLEELRKNNPELYNKIKNSAIEEERSRIKGLDEIRNAGNATIVDKAKYETFASVEATAIEIIKAENAVKAQAFQNRQEDAKPLDVIPQTTTEPVGVDDDNVLDTNLVSSIVSYANEGR